MKQRVADYIAEFFAHKGINHIFTVTGGGAMHLNDALGHHQKLQCTYNHHEQACAIAAEAFARYSGRLAAVCVTSGPGGTNALTGVLGGWLDSIPMFIVSGQVKFTTTIRSTHVPLRQLGDQEFNITDCVKSMTKFAEMIVNPGDIAYLLERALFIATNGRPGPVWLDVPLNVQGAIIETADLRHYDPIEDAREIPRPVPDKMIDEVLGRIARARRPVVFAGAAIRGSGAHEEFLSLVEKLGVPVVTAWNAHDAIWDEHPLYCGRPGTIGNRGGNFVVQASDFLLVLGSRLNVRQISYNWENFAPRAYKVVVDIDPAELEKPTLSIDIPIHADVKDFIISMNRRTAGVGIMHNAWLSWCRRVNQRYPVTLPEYYRTETPLNPYVFMTELFSRLSEGDAIITGNGSACVCSFQAANLKRDQRLFTNSGCASMGYGLPAALGVAIARAGSRVICLDGDGSIQMNLQELQTVVHNRVNLKIFWLNNDGYHSIRQTQLNLFGPPLCGVSSDSGISFPAASRIAEAYGIPFTRIDSLSTIGTGIANALSTEGPMIIEVVLDPDQFFAPKLSARVLTDGTMVSPSLEDMYPFLDHEEIESLRLEAESL